jgi:N-acetylneuraminic acid mutarotase
MVWVKPFVQGASPAGRGGCAAAVVGDMCLFIGGADRSPCAFSDVWVLKLGGRESGSSRWIRKTTTVRGGARLPERAGATATAVGRKVYVFGGQEPTRGVCFNDVVVLDCNTWVGAGMSLPPGMSD